MRVFWQEAVCFAKMESEMESPKVISKKKARGKKWSEAEELAVIQAVLEEETALFGQHDRPGPSSSKKERGVKWAGIAQTVSA